MPTYYLTENEDELHITPWEFVMDCNPREINETIKVLIDGGLLTKETTELYTKKCSAPEQIFEKHLSKIHGKLLQLTAEEEEAIIHIAKRVGD
jgi:pyridoxal biosynthesis lyase PdxS